MPEPWRRRLRIVGYEALAIGLLLAVTLPALAPSAKAQSNQAVSSGGQATALPATLTLGQVDALLATMTDAQVREALALELRERAAPEAVSTDSGGGVGMALARFRFGIEAFAERLRTSVAVLRQGIRELPAALAGSIDKITGGQGAWGLLGQLAAFAALLLVGMGVHGLVRRADGLRQNLETEATPSLMARVGRSSFRAALDLVAAAAFAAVTIGIAALLFDADNPTRSVVVALLTGALVVYVAALVARFVFAPFAPPLRCLPLSNSAARFLYRWLVLLIGVGAYAWLIAGVLILTGLPLAVHLVIVLVTGALMEVLVIAMILRSRAAVAAAITGANPAASPLRVQIARTWHVFAILYIVIVWLLWAMSMLSRGQSAIWPAIASLAVVAVLPVIDRAVAGALARAFAGSPPEGSESHDDQPGAPEPGLTGRHYADVIMGVVRLVYVIGAVLLLLQLWGIDLFGVSGTAAEASIRKAAFDIAVTLLLAAVIWQLAKTMIDRNLRNHESHGEVVEAGARARTLLPLLRSVVLVVLLVLVTMIVLSSLGVDIGPLLAGAGVLGLAVGFGAQALVRDVVAGVFFLIDDAFRVGEYIEMGDIRGEVEKISIRSLTLRHHRGAVHTVPFGELRSITNYNRDWVIMKLAFRVAYDTDINLVKRIFKQIGKELLEDPEMGPNIIETLKSQGVTSMEDSAMIVRGKFMTKPREQFVVRREVYSRVQAAFEANGIEFAHREVKVHVPSGLSPQHAAAAARAIEDHGGPEAAKAS